VQFPFGGDFKFSCVSSRISNRCCQGLFTFLGRHWSWRRTQAGLHREELAAATKRVIAKRNLNGHRVWHSIAATREGPKVCRLPAAPLEEAGFELTVPQFSSCCARPSFLTRISAQLSKGLGGFRRHGGIRGPPEADLIAACVNWTAYIDETDNDGALIRAPGGFLSRDERWGGFNEARIFCKV